MFYYESERVGNRFWQFTPLFTQHFTLANSWEVEVLLYSKEWKNHNPYQTYLHNLYTWEINNWRCFLYWKLLGCRIPHWKKIPKVLIFLSPLIKSVTLLKEILKCSECQISWQLKYISTLGQNLPKSTISGQNNQFQVHLHNIINIFNLIYPHKKGRFNGINWDLNKILSWQDFIIINLENLGLTWLISVKLNENWIEI